MCHTSPHAGADSLPRSALGALTPPPAAADIPNVKTFLDYMWKAVDNWSFYETEAKKKQKPKKTQTHKMWKTVSNIVVSIFAITLFLNE